MPTLPFENVSDAAHDLQTDDGRRPASDVDDRPRPIPVEGRESRAARSLNRDVLGHGGATDAPPADHQRVPGLRRVDTGLERVVAIVSPRVGHRTRRRRCDRRRHDEHDRDYC